MATHLLDPCGAIKKGRLLPRILGHRTLTGSSRIVGQHESVAVLPPAAHQHFIVLTGANLASRAKFTLGIKVYSQLRPHAILFT